MKILQTILFLLIGVSITLWGDILLKKSELINLKYLGPGMLLYVVVAIPVAAAFRLHQFGIVIVLWQAIIISAGLVIGWLVCKANHVPEDHHIYYRSDNDRFELPGFQMI